MVASILNAAAWILILERLMSFPVLMLQVSVICLDVYQLISTVVLEMTYICLHSRVENTNRNKMLQAEWRKKKNLAILPNFL